MYALWGVAAAQQSGAVAGPSFIVEALRLGRAAALIAVAQPSSGHAGTSRYVAEPL
jgi:hypothetical protein